MTLNTYGFFLTGNEFPTLCGPRELVDLVIQFRQRDALGLRAPLSDANVERLVFLAFNSSLLPEEGRFLNYRILAGTPPSAPWLAVGFHIPLYSVEILRRLAPTAADDNATLVVVEEDDQLICRGIAVGTEMGFDRRVGVPKMGGIPRATNLSLRVEGPGCLRVSESAFQLRLRGGRIRENIDFRVVPAVIEWWNELASRLMAKIVTTHGEAANSQFGGHVSVAEMVHKAFSRVLSGTIASRHGGTFVVLPTSERVDPAEFGVLACRDANFQLGEEIAEYWSACVQHALSKDDHQRREAAEKWHWRNESLFVKAGLLANLAAADGCVVFNRRLDLLGFAGKIDIESGSLSGATRPLTHLGNGGLIDESILNLGTRHGSALRLCRKHAGTLAFVVSQDSELRVFYSDDRASYGVESLDAWVRASEIM